MAFLLVIGVTLAVAGLVLLFNVAGRADFVMRHVTSKYLGTLPPGYANSKAGFRVYCVLLISIGCVFIGVFLAAKVVALGVALLLVGLAGFAATSVIAIRGEVATTREKKS
jgi:hypothetical protein